MSMVILLHIFLLFIFIERIRGTFSNKQNYLKYKTNKEALLCWLMVALYIIVLLAAFSQIYIGFSLNTITFLGLFMWILGVWYRRNAIKSLGKNWSIYRTPNHLKRFLTLGTYAYSRHPYYSASILELIGYALIFQSQKALLLIFFIYLPLTIVRALQEEQMLSGKFGNQYKHYQNSTPFILNIHKLIHDSRMLNHLKQLVIVHKKYGFKQILRILFMNKAVQRYFRNYIISQCVIALDKIGLIDELMAEESVDLVQFSQARTLNFRILKLVCDYLYVIRIFNKRTLEYSLTPYGSKLIANARGVFNFIHAYSPIFENLDALIDNRKVYGRDIIRRGEFVGKASAELAELFPFPVARNFLSKYGFKNILDLGSGSGDFLIGFCKEKSVCGYGIDLSPDAVVYAEKKAIERGVNERVQFVVGDILKLQELNGKIKAVDIVTCMFVLHEFLSISEKLVLDILESVRKAYPDKHLLICELTRCSLDHLYHLPSGIMEHHFFHYLSNQGLATAEEWRNIFSKAKFAVVEEERLDLAEQSIFLLKPIK